MSQLHCCALMSIENDILREIDFTGIITEFASGSSIKYVMLFLANFDSLPLSHFVTHPGTPKSTSHISDPLFLVSLVQKSRINPPVQILSQLFEGFLSGGFLIWNVLSGVVYVFSRS